MDRINDKVATAQDSTGRDATRDVRQVSSAGGSSRDTSIPKIRVLPADVERESQKVRSLYDSDGTVDWRDGGWVPALVERLEPPAVEAQSDEMENVATPSPVSGRPSQDPPSNTLAMGTPRSGRSLSPRRDSPSRREFELAGGLEDWEGVAGADVDRYGFISPKGWESVVGGLDKPRSARLSPTNENRLEMSTRPSSSPSASGLSPMRQPSRKFSARSLYTQASEYSNTSRRSARSTIRHATNRLPHNKGRRWVEEAGEMLTQIPGLADIEEDEQAGKLAEASKRKEWGRSEKWRKMAKVVKKSNEGEGTAFEFDTKNQKLIDRTWKGIPDCWRAAAWYSFLATSAKQVKSAETDEHLISEFHRLQEVGSPDDVQIDLDVPRTINRHIMFRRRYRGGQRLLFRVLHSISLYFPDTGYVQGMASLAATLLCYYDEERCFVMLVRMWRHRGLEYLYQAGFDGLMATLKEFENVWLEGKDVARKLNELSIDATAYATRWYLTLFNLSIPFPAQLRVWDVFMLLGEPAPRFLNGRETEFQKGRQTSSACYDVLHATSAALIDALRDVLLDSDFENAMKALTSWIPIKDEEMLMKVTRAEWKRRQGKKKS
ncbi:hypothetical protein VTK73DRAFT_10008 [Phialemonium thermophilum]|uniref:Rab-GAP TBC domain-containing protein n=1 Tax=Phialemonium thermophilum TaxID=223376 RepID=A0ABR3Y445_9PEZI